MVIYLDAFVSLRHDLDDEWWIVRNGNIRMFRVFECDFPVWDAYVREGLVRWL